MATKVGLLGGSFDPPHMGHFAVAEHAHKVLGLDEVWLLITPQNPEKARQATSFNHRFKMCELMAESNDWLKPSDFEQRTKLTNTHDVLEALLPQHADKRFVWLMGADNLQTAHTWNGWRKVMDEMLPMAIYARPEFMHLLDESPLMRNYATSKVAANAAVGEAPQWRVINDFEHPASSTKIRHMVNSKGINIDVFEQIAEYIQEHKLYR